MKKVLFLLMLAAFISCTNNSKYMKDASMVSISMLTVEDVCNTVSGSYIEVWNKTLTGGYYDNRYFSNFSEAVHYKKEQFEETFKNLDNLINSIELDMKKLSEPSSKTKELHESLIKMYTATKRYYDIVKAPTGSLFSYSNECHQLSTDIRKIYNEIKIRTSNND